MDFIFHDPSRAIKAISQLLRYENGFFGNQFARGIYSDGSLVGIQLGYDKEQLSKQELKGVINMLKVTKATHWPHLIGPVRKALSDYVPEPSQDSYYINNFAISGDLRGKGLGEKLMHKVVANATSKGYQFIEADVSSKNTRALKFYRRVGFYPASESGSKLHEAKYKLPRLTRIRLRLRNTYAVDLAHNSRIINDISGMNPVAVDEVFIPGSIEQLQNRLKQNKRPISISGGRFSMGGQTSHKGSLQIETKGLNDIVEINHEKKTVTVLAGTAWRQILERLTDQGLSIKVMQTYADFTVGGSVSVNCHGRYIGQGPIVLSVNEITLLLYDGEKVVASRLKNSDIFYATIGGYGALGIIVQVELSLTKNTRIERITEKMKLERYSDFFFKNVRSNTKAVYHNADLIPPHFKDLRSTTWEITEKAVNSSKKDTDRELYLLNKYMFWAVTETPLGHLRRKFIYEPLLNMKSKVTMRNAEADYSVLELEPFFRNRKTYVLQEYFVPVLKLNEFCSEMVRILKLFKVNVVNVSIRHSQKDPGTLLAWAREEVYSLVLYYKQGVTDSERDGVGIWTRQLIDAVIRFKGSYYLPYQNHSRLDQFHACYPNAKKLFLMKERLDPHYRLRNSLWERYYKADKNPEYFPSRDIKGSDFLKVFNDLAWRDKFYSFLENIFTVYPPLDFFTLISQTCRKENTDEAIYRSLAKGLPSIKPMASDLRYALPALAKQKREMERQTRSLLKGKGSLSGYLEIGSTGRYLKHLKKALNLRGPAYLTNDHKPDYSLPEIMERGGIRQTGTFFALDDYAPISKETIPSNSLDLITCFIGLHHCPVEKLFPYLKSLHRLLRKGGNFILRDHNAKEDQMKTFCSLVHTVFNVGLGISWKENAREFKNFEEIDTWIELVCKAGFSVDDQQLLQDSDPSLNTLVLFIKL